MIDAGLADKFNAISIRPHQAVIADPEEGGGVPEAEPVALTSDAPAAPEPTPAPPVAAAAPPAPAPDAPPAAPSGGGEAVVAQSADGVTHQFAPGTPPEVIDKVMKAYAESHRDRSTVGGQMLTGFMDPVEGGGQLVSNALSLIPGDPTKALDAFNNWLSDKTGGLIRKLPEGGKNQQIKEREKEVKDTRGNSDSLDLARMAGNVLNPVNYIGGTALTGTKLAAKAGPYVTAALSGLIGGAVGGAEAPATDKDFWSEKAEQTGLGAGLGVGVGTAGAAIARGVSGLGQYVARNYPDNITTQAVNAVVRRIKQDAKTSGVSAADAIDLINASKKPLTLADVVGENTTGLAGNVARQPGESRAIASQFLRERDEDAAQRLTQDIGQHLFGGKTMHQATEALLQSRSAAARPAYDKAHGLQGIWSPRLAQFFDDPTIQAGMARGYDIERMLALAEGRPITATQLGVDIDMQGGAKLLGTPNMRLLDMAKQGLDALVADERNAITGRLSARGVALDKLRRAYIETIDDLDKTGAYKKARAEWAGYSSNMDAIKLGRAAFKLSPEENAAALAKLSEPNKEFYRLGLADLLKERLAKAGFRSDEAQQIIRNPWMRDQLRPAFRTSEDFEKFVQAVTEESQMFGTKQAVMGGSPTAARVAEDAGGTGGDMLVRGGKLLRDLAHGRPLATIKHFMQFYRDLGLKPNPELNEKIAQILFATDLPAGSQLVEKLTGKAESVLRNPAAKAAAATLFATKMGASTQGAASGATIDSLSRPE